MQLLFGFVSVSYVHFIYMECYCYLQSSQYKYLGKYTVKSITQGGCGVPFLALPVYEYISTGKLPTDVEAHLRNIPDVTPRFVLQKV